MKKIEKLNPNQIEMLKFLRHSSEEYRMDLDSAFPIGTDTTNFKDCNDLVDAGYVKRVDKRSWSTKEGKDAYEAERPKRVVSAIKK